MTLSELMQERNKVWDDMRTFLDSKRSADGLLSDEDSAAYDAMQKKLDAYGKEIERTKKLNDFENSLKEPTSDPILGNPGDQKITTKSDEYKNAFFDMIRGKNYSEIKNALEVGVDTEGGYLVPDEFEKTLIQKLEDENIFRSLAKIITTSGDRKIPVVSAHGSANWIDEEAPYTESDEVFGQVVLGAHKIGTIMKVSEELLHDSAFNLESYISSEFSRRIGRKEEEAFFTGDGTGKPTGIFAATGGGEIGATTTGTAITFDDMIELFYSLGSAYRKKAVWILGDTSVKALRKIKDTNGNYIWQPSVSAGIPDTILNKPYYTSAYAPAIEAGKSCIAFGDMSYYWIADRVGISFQKLNELFALNGQVGFKAYKRVDGKLILPEAVKILKIKSA